MQFGEIGNNNSATANKAAEIDPLFDLLTKHFIETSDEISDRILLEIEAMD